MKEISIGNINDTIVYAFADHLPCGSVALYPATDLDTQFIPPDVLIRCDSGVYPGITDADAYICQVAARELNARGKTA